MRFGRMAALVLVSCGVTYVKGPDGNLDWFKVECRREGTCMKKAAAQCPSGFLLAESETSSSTFYEKGPANDEDDSQGTLHSMLARCGSEKEEKRRDDDDEPFKPIAKPKNLAECGRVFDKLDELATAWLEWHPGAEAPPAKPTRPEFINVCGDLPETAQFCLNPKYEHNHQQECADAFENLPAKNRVRLARLFEKDGDNPKDMVVAPPPVVDDGGLEAGIGDAGKDGGKPKPGTKPVPAAVVKKKGPSDASVE